MYAETLKRNGLMVKDALMTDSELKTVEIEHGSRFSNHVIESTTFGLCVN